MNRMKNPRFASERDADKGPASTSYSENEIEHENDLSVAGIAALLASAAIAQQRPPTTPRCRTSPRTRAFLLPYQEKHYADLYEI